MTSRILAFFSIAAIIFLASCGGRPANQPAEIQILASQVFSNTAQTWTFKNGYGDITTVEVKPQPDGSTIWHYSKNADRAYWAPGAASAELWFHLALIDGRWYSTGGHVLFPFGAPWDATPQDFSYTVALDPGMPRPYLIIGDSGTTVDTTFPDFGPHTRWKTKMYVKDGFLISEQWEGQCVHETWWFKPGRGLWKIEVNDTGNCQPADPGLTMVRI